ncbi:MAG: hypothetical protein KKF44_05285 [Nanoarchaeota archaeon]|nr:hypothetical protein [Nanoarchaeota archaeon]
MGKRRIKKTRNKKFLQVFTLRNFLILSLTIALILAFRKLRYIVYILILIGMNCLFGYIKFVLFRNFGLANFIGRFVLLRHLANAIEIILFTSVIAGIKFGPGTGLAVGGLAILGTYIFEQRVSEFSIATIPVYMILGYAAYFAKDYFGSIFALGCVFALLYNIIINVVLVFFYRAKLIKMISFSILNILFNAYLFYYVGPIFMRLV